MNRKSYPSDLTDEQWDVLFPALPPARTGGRPRTVDLREVINGILYVLRAGCSWRMVPHDLPPWQTLYKYFRQILPPVDQGWDLGTSPRDTAAHGPGGHDLVALPGSGPRRSRRARLATSAGGGARGPAVADGPGIRRGLNPPVGAGFGVHARGAAETEPG